MQKYICMKCVLLSFNSNILNTCSHFSWGEFKDNSCQYPATSQPLKRSGPIFHIHNQRLAKSMKEMCRY